MKFIYLLLLLIPSIVDAGYKPSPKIVRALQQAATKANVPYRLIAAICFVESSFRSHVINKMDGDADSIGLCQIKKLTAEDMGFDGNSKELLNPFVNALYAAKYLKFQLIRYDGDWARAISAYNKGNSGHKIENKTYVNKVLKMAVEI